MVKDNKNNKSLEEMFNNISNEDAKITDTKESKIKKKKVSIVIGTLASVLLLGVGGAYYISQQETVKVERSTNTVTVKDTGNKINDSTNNQTIPLPEWAKKHYSTLNEDESNQMLTSLDNGIFGNLIQSIPSVNEGYTSDKLKMLDEEGFPNLYYTTFTQEDVKSEIIVYLNRIINPIFGGYIDFQYGTENKPEDINPLVYSDMFTEDYLTKHKNNIPLLVDKDKNNFGYEWEDTKDNKKARVIGIVQDIEELSSNDEFTEITIKARVATFANTKNSQIRKNYNVTMKLVGNEEGNSDNKLLISDFEMKESE